MDIETIRAFLMWCTIINGGLLILSSLMLACAGGWVHRILSKFFPMSREAFNIAIYSLIQLYKIFILVFNLIPWIALEIVA